MAKDTLTSKYFNNKVIFNSPKDYTIGDFVLDYQVAAGLTGAMDGSVIDLALVHPDSGSSQQALKARLSVRHEFLAQEAVFEVEQNEGSYSCLQVEYVVLKPQHTAQGLGIRMFAHQAYMAKTVGIQQIFLRAVADASYNGAYTWPRYGFQALMDVPDQAKFATLFPGVKDLAELMSTEQGRAWWKSKAFTLSMYFDLNEPICTDTLEAYMAEKGVQIV